MKYKLTQEIQEQNKHLGKSIALKFDLGTAKDAKYGMVRLTGHFLLLQPLGSYPPVDLENLSRIEQHCIEWALSIGLIQKNHSYYEKFKKSKLAALTAYTLPGVSLELSKWFIYLQVFIFTLDDVLDNLIDIRAEKERLDYLTLKEIINIFTNITIGKFKSINEISPKDFPLFYPFCSALFTIREYAIKSGLDIHYFVASLARYLRSVVLEHSEHCEVNLHLKEIYLFVREQTISYYQSIETFCLIKGIVLSEEIRKNRLFKGFFKLACQHVILVNDVFSLEKEIKYDELDNILLIKQHKSLQQAFNLLVNKINQIALEVDRLSKQLLKVFPSNKPLTDFIEVIKNSIDGHFFWYANSLRYGMVKFNYFSVEFENIDNFSLQSHRHLFFIKPLSSQAVTQEQHIDGNNAAAKEEKLFTRSKL